MATSDEMLKQKEMTVKIKHFLIRTFCFIRGHDWTSYSLNNADIFEGIWRSSWGYHTCARCGKEVTWQWDRP